jgi:hypothetical protein
MLVWVYDDVNSENNAIVFEELSGSIRDQRHRQTISWNESTVKIW